MCGVLPVRRVSYGSYASAIKDMFDDKSTTIFDNDGFTQSVALISLLYSNSHGNLCVYVDTADNFALVNPYLNHLLKKAAEERKVDINVIIQEDVFDLEYYPYLSTFNFKTGITLNVEGEPIKNFITMDGESLRIEKSAETANGCFHDPLIVGKLNNLFMEHF